jgi:hypothetical protein
MAHLLVDQAVAVTNLVLEELSQTPEAEARRGRHRDDDGDPFSALALTPNLRAAA